MVKKIPPPKALPQTPKKATSLEARDGHIIWSFRFFDFTAWDGESESESSFREIARRLKETESRSWNEIRRNERRDHYVEVSKLSGEAKKRLSTLGVLDDSLFRFRFTGKHRLWGLRQGDYFFVLWWDPEHMVYPINIQDRS